MIRLNFNLNLQFNVCKIVNFYVKVYKSSLFPNPITDLVYIWCDDTNWSKILRSTIPTPH